MPYTIAPLSPAIAEDFSALLTNLDFSQTPHWASCFCRYYYLTCSFEEWRNRSLETNRAEAMREIEAGNMQGYLAYADGVCVGWCNANDVLRLPRIAEDLSQYCSNQRVGCTICFVIHPAHRSRGLARQMLARVIEDYRAAGFDAMLALPIEAPGAEQKRYRGTLHMYQEAGYREIGVLDAAHVMRLALHATE